jgi:hypothetical protein
MNNEFIPSLQKIITLANNYSVTHDLHDADNLRKLTLIIIQETLNVVDSEVMVMRMGVRKLKPDNAVTHDMDIYKDQIPIKKEKLID